MIPTVRQNWYTPYVEAVERPFGIDVDYAMLVKKFRSDNPNSEPRVAKVHWQYLKIRQKAFEVLPPSRLADLKALSPLKLF